MLTNKEKLMLEEHLYRVIKSRLNEDQTDDADKDAEERGKKASMTSKLQTILPALQDTYDDSKQSYNLTRSQISYEMYPNLDPDTAIDFYNFVGATIDVENQENFAYFVGYITERILKTLLNK